VRDFLKDLGLEVRVLSEQPDESRTIIEKKYSDVGFAIILLTADDWGQAKRNASKEATRSGAPKCHP
jgi:predicted nucleotide-binding protein